MVFLPVVFTVLLLQIILKAADAWVVDPLYQILPFEVDRKTALIFIKILISLIVFLFICIVGWGTEIFVVKKIISFGEGVLSRVPMVNPIYSTIKEVIHALVGEKKALFRSAVLVQYPRLGIYTMGFITKSSIEVLKEKTGKEMASVFVPTTPNPTSGVLIFISKEDVIELSIPIDEAIKLLISGGTIGGMRTRMGAR